MILSLSVILLATLSTVQPQPPEPTHIINGQPAADKQFPHQVFFIIKKDLYYVCGGNLISNRWIVTAAHCFLNAVEFVAIMGTLKPLPLTTVDGRVTMIGNEYYIHEGYDGLVLNDVSLVKLPQAVQFNDKIRPIKIATDPRSYYGEMAITSGWGQTVDGGSLAATLQYASMRVISNEECWFAHFSLVYPSTLCAVGPNREAPCHGDSGGPLVSVTDGTLIGITSFGNPYTCEMGVPDGFTRVTSYVDWIRTKTGLPL